MSMDEVRIKVEHAGFSYWGPGNEQVFEDISFHVHAGQTLCILGPNGTGKSTVLKCLNNILQIHTGKISINGKNINGLSPSEIAGTVGYVPQNLSSAFPFPIRNVVVMGRATYVGLFSSPAKQDVEIAEAAMEKIGISHLADRPCNTVSGGEWQLALMARALTQQPEIMLLDEPTSHLDLGNQIKILEVIAQLAEDGMTVVMATHFPDHAFISASQVLLLKDRKIAAMGKPEEVITDRSMAKVYGVTVKIMQVEIDEDRKVCIPILRKPDVVKEDILDAIYP